MLAPSRSKQRRGRPGCPRLRKPFANFVSVAACAARIDGSTMLFGKLRPSLTGLLHDLRTDTYRCAGLQSQGDRVAGPRVNDARNASALKYRLGVEGSSTRRSMRTSCSRAPTALSSSAANACVNGRRASARNSPMAIASPSNPPTQTGKPGRSGPCQPKAVGRLSSRTRPQARPRSSRSRRCRSDWPAGDTHVRGHHRRSAARCAAFCRRRAGVDHFTPHRGRAPPTPR